MPDTARCPLSYSVVKQTEKKKRGPQPETLKIELPIREALRRLVRPKKKTPREPQPHEIR